MMRERLQKKRTNLNIPLDEWVSLALLLDKGIQLEEALKLSFHDPAPFLDLLKEGKNCFSIDGICTNRFLNYLQFFMHAAPMSHAITSSVQLCKVQRQMIQQFCKESSYPFLLFIMSFVLISFFLSTIFPQMQQSIDAEVNSYALILLNGLLVIFLLFFILCVTILLISLFLYYQKDARNLFIMHFHHRLPFFQSIISYLFAAYLSSLMQAGLSTLDALSLLERLEAKNVIYPCITEMKHLLEKGFSYEEIIQTSTYFSDRFRHFFAIGQRSSTLMDTLMVFMDIQQKCWQKQLKKGGILLQLSVYVMIAVLVFCMYQMLLMPLDMLNQM